MFMLIITVCAIGEKGRVCAPVAQLVMPSMERCEALAEDNSAALLEAFSMVGALGQVFTVCASSTEGGVSS